MPVSEFEKARLVWTQVIYRDANSSCIFQARIAENERKMREFGLTPTKASKSPISNSAKEKKRKKGAERRSGGEVKKSTKGKQKGGVSEGRRSGRDWKAAASPLTLPVPQRSSARLQGAPRQQYVLDTYIEDDSYEESDEEACAKGRRRKGRPGHSSDGDSDSSGEKSSESEFDDDGDDDDDDDDDEEEEDAEDKKTVLASMGSKRKPTSALRRILKRPRLPLAQGGGGGRGGGGYQDDLFAARPASPPTHLRGRGRDKLKKERSDEDGNSDEDEDDPTRIRGTTVDMTTFHDAYLGKFIRPRDGQLKKAAMVALCGGRTVPFNRLSGIQEFRNVVALFINVTESKSAPYLNTFHANSTRVVWFAQPRQKLMHPTIQRILAYSRQSDAPHTDGSLLLFARLPLDAYCYCGRLVCVERDVTNTIPMRFVFRLVDAPDPRLSASPDFAFVTGKTTVKSEDDVDILD